MRKTLTALGLILGLATTPATAQTYPPQTRSAQTGEQVLGAIVGALILGAIVHEVTKDKDNDKDKPSSTPRRPDPRPAPQSRDRGHHRAPGHQRRARPRVIPAQCLAFTGPRHGYVEVAQAHCLESRYNWRTLPAACLTSYGRHTRNEGYVVSCLERRGWRLP